MLATIVPTEMSKDRIRLVVKGEPLLLSNGGFTFEAFRGEKPVLCVAGPDFRGERPSLQINDEVDVELSDVARATYILYIEKIDRAP